MATLACQPPRQRFSSTDVLAVGESPAVVYPASIVDSVVVPASMESAGPMRQTMQEAVGKPQELSVSNSLGCIRLTIWGNQSRPYVATNAYIGVNGAQTPCSTLEMSVTWPFCECCWCAIFSSREGKRNGSITLLGSTLGVCRLGRLQSSTGANGDRARAHQSGVAGQTTVLKWVCGTPKHAQFRVL